MTTINQDELLTRGVEKIYPSKEALEKELAAGRPLRIYFGIDPTGPSLHLGHAVNLIKLREWQDQGHAVILLLGDFTATIGDPTDKTAARVKLSAAQVQANMKSYLDQAGKILDLSKTEIRYNSEWLGRLNLVEILELASSFTVGQMIERDMFQERIKQAKPIYSHEFLYPLMQGYDSVVLDVDLEIGGNDQTFNMLAGRTLMKKLKNKEKFVLTTKLLTDPSGKKMGKTEGNMVSFADAPNDAYGKVMSWPDELLPLCYELGTRINLADVAAAVKQNPYEAKRRLAREIAHLLFGNEAAAAAENNFIQAFQKQNIPDELPELAAAPGEKLSEVLLRAKIVSSKSDWRRLVTEKAIRDLSKNETITDPDYLISKSLILRVGKHRFVKIVS